MKKVFCIMLALVLVLSLLAGCGDKGTTTNADDRVLKIRKLVPLAGTDYGMVTHTDDFPLVFNSVFEGLYGIDEHNGGYYNELAKDIQVSDDGLVYTITLVDATFQNGDKLKASDVVFSYKRAMDMSRFNYVTTMIDSVEAVDDQTVKITLQYPYSAIAHTFYTIRIVSEKEVTEQGEAFGTKPHTAATGPYIITDYDPAGTLKLKAYEGYWGGAPAIKNVEYVLITEDSAAVIAYENGEIDFMANSPTSEWDSLEKAANGNSVLLRGNNIRPVFINHDSPTNNRILSNILVRQAICYAIDKDMLNEVAANGMGFVTGEFIPSAYCATSPSEDTFETFDYNPDKAIELLHEAGYSDADLAAGVSVGTITTYGAATGEKAKMAQVVQSNLKAVGLIAEVEVQDSSIITPRLHAFDYDLCIYGDSGNFDFNNIRQQLLYDGGYQCLDYSTETSPMDYDYICEALQQGITLTDTAERLKVYTELWQKVAETATLYPCLSLPVANVWSDRIDPGDGDDNPTYYHLKTFSWK